MITFGVWPALSMTSTTKSWATPRRSVSASRIWVGGYTDDMNGSAEGIRLLKVAADGSLEDHGVAVAADSPSFLTRSGDMIYATCEGGPAVAGYRVVGDELHFQGVQDAAGTFPCSLGALRDHSALVVACYGTGTIDVHPLSPDGAIQKTAQTLRGEGNGVRIEQEGPHAHDVLQLDATTVLTTDLGTDHVYIHRVDGDLLTRIGSVAFPAGTGPRDLFAHPSGLIWVVAELSQQVFVLRRSDETLEIVSQVSLAGAESDDHASAIGVSEDGKFAYVGLRGSDNISVLAVSADGATLSAVGFVGSGGGWPRHLVVDGSRLRVANQLTSSVVTFALGPDGIPVKESSLYVPSPTYLLLD
jgi:6-phosphogluconolactonase